MALRLQLQAVSSLSIPPYPNKKLFRMKYLSTYNNIPLLLLIPRNVFEDINPFVYPSIRETMEVSVKMVNEGCEASDKCKVYVKRGRGNQGGAQDGFDRSLQLYV